MMNEGHTGFIYGDSTEYLGTVSQKYICPRLFVCSEHEIMEFVLAGHQMVGRPADGVIPDIPVMNKFVSRCHGYFDVTEDKITFTAVKTTNGTIFRRKILADKETVDLWDGDEIIIPAADDGNSDVMLVCAFAESRINIWRGLRLASRDALTGLSGRNTFKTWFLQKYARVKDIELSLFILDIDFFKRINDVYGHAAGDEALKILTEHILRCVGADGYVCRWGGDEFVGVIPADGERAYGLLDKMSKELNEIKVSDLFKIGVSAGVVDINKAYAEKLADDIDGLVVLADRALYLAKDEGKGCIRLFKNNIS